MKFKLLLILFLSISMKGLIAQNSIQNLYYKPRTKPNPHFNGADHDPSNRANFYIYRNCVYRFRPYYGGDWIVKVTDIRNDSIYFEPYGPVLGQQPRSTQSLHPSEISGITRVSDRLSETFKTVHLNTYWPVLTQDSFAKSFPVRYVNIPGEDSSSNHQVEIVQYLIGRGLMPTYLKCGKAYYYDSLASMVCGQGTTVDSPLVKWIKTRDGIWFTPSRANKINGLNVGLLTMSFRDEPLTISGVNLNADLLGLLFFMYSFFPNPNNSLDPSKMSDTLTSVTPIDRINGFSISGGGILDDFEIRGIAINGMICGYTSIKGISITGLTSMINEFHGLAIGGVKNFAVKGNGLQIGLINRCKYLKGLQIGLWNVNSKRSLPLINWGI